MASSHNCAGHLVVGWVIGSVNKLAIDRSLFRLSWCVLSTCLLSCCIEFDHMIPEAIWTHVLPLLEKTLWTLVFLIDWILFYHVHHFNFLCHFVHNVYLVHLIHLAHLIHPIQLVCLAQLVHLIQLLHLICLVQLVHLIVGKIKSLNLKFRIWILTRLIGNCKFKNVSSQWREHKLRNEHT